MLLQWCLVSVSIVDTEGCCVAGSKNVPVIASLKPGSPLDKIRRGGVDFHHVLDMVRCVWNYSPHPASGADLDFLRRGVDSN